MSASFNRAIEEARIGGTDKLSWTCHNDVTIPQEICQLTNLQKLRLSNNQITSLPSDFHLLTDLRHLYLCDNRITSLPPDFHLLTNLQELYLDNNPINHIDHQILVQITDIDIPVTVTSQVPVNLPQII